MFFWGICVLGWEVVVMAVPGAPLVHYCTRVEFVQGVAIGRRKCHLLPSPIVRFSQP